MSEIAKSKMYRYKLKVIDEISVVLVIDPTARDYDITYSRLPVSPDAARWYIIAAPVDSSMPIDHEYDVWYRYGDNPSCKGNGVDSSLCLRCRLIADKLYVQSIEGSLLSDVQVDDLAKLINLTQELFDASV